MAVAVHAALRSPQSLTDALLLAATADADEAFTDADYAIFLGAFPRKEGMERKDVMSKNVGIFNAQGSALAKAKSTVRAVVVGNPANTNAAILAKAAGIAPTQISALTRLDHNRATYMVAAKCGASCGDVEGVYIWGNHSSTQYPDVSHCKVKGAAPALDAEWKSATFEPTVQKRGAAVIAARKASSAASAAKAVCDHMRDWSSVISLSLWLIIKTSLNAPLDHKDKYKSLQRASRQGSERSEQRSEPTQPTGALQERLKRP